MTNDPYADFAERYEWMMEKNPAREQFFQRLFTGHGVSKILDCACGTGRDLILFESIGYEVCGSDLSDAMLKQARENLARAGVEIPVQKVDFCRLAEHYEAEFDAVVCLTNAINELLEDAETLKALKSMKSVLRPGGILVFDQGQTDTAMKNPPRFAPVVNTRDLSRLLAMDYSGNIATVNILDFIHTDQTIDFKQSAVRIRIRLQYGWKKLLRKAGFSDVMYYGDWDSSEYCKKSSPRLIIVAEK